MRATFLPLRYAAVIDVYGKIKLVMKAFLFPYKGNVNKFS